MPLGVPDHERLDARDALDGQNRGANALRDHALHRAAGRGQCMRDTHRVAVDRDVVDETERDDVEPDLRIDHRGERGPDCILERFGRHAVLAA